MSSSFGTRSILFLHIPKAAGSTLRTIIDRQYAEEEIFTIDGANVDASIDRFCRLPHAKKERIRCLKGHMAFGLHEHLDPPSTYVTILRDPIERIISHYYYVLRKPSHYLHEEIISRNMSLREYANSGLSDELKNGMTRLISGDSKEVAPSEMLKNAKRNLSQHFSVVGLVERFDESLVLMKQRLGWKRIYYQKKNVGHNRPRKDNVANATLDVIRAANMLDLQLYEYAQKRLEQDLRTLNLRFELQKLRLWCDIYKGYKGLRAMTRDALRTVRSS